jgi:ABC-2 type transport system permease protein
MQNVVWKDQFLHGFAFGQLLFMFIVLLVGAGAIANDNRANALLVYLSKPCDKRDYLVGKWVGVWLSVLAAMGVPTAFFFFYAGMTYSEYGFFDDKLLIVKLLLLLPIGAAFYTSLILGISSLFHNSRFAGATLAAIYILSNFFTKLMEGAWQVVQFDRGAQRDIGGAADVIGWLYYASLDGLEQGLAKGILGTRGGPPFGIAAGPRRMMPEPPPIPSVWVILLIMAALSAIAIWIAWRRVRAVEVVS